MKKMTLIVITRLFWFYPALECCWHHRADQRDVVKHPRQTLTGYALFGIFLLIIAILSVIEYKFPKAIYMGLFFFLLYLAVGIFSHWEVKNITKGNTFFPEH